MVTQTLNYNWDKPDPGGDKDVWGTLQNGALDGVDAQVKVNEELVAALAVIVGDLETNLQGQIDQLNLDLVPAIGEILITSDPANPVARYPGTTWVALEGVVLVGVGTSPSADAKVWALDDQEGNESHVVSEAEMPSHAHGAGSYQTGFASSTNTGTGSNNRLNGNPGGDQFALTGNSGAAGGGGAHNNLQPTLAKHIWERTA